MNISKLSAFLLGLSLFLLVVPVSRADVPVMKNVESACLETTRCNAQGATGLCAPDEPYPLVWGHRAHLEVKSGLSSGKVFIQECLEYGGAGSNGQICLNVPIIADTTAPSGWRLKNYKADHVAGQNDNVKWTADRQMFIDAKLQECISSYVDPSEGASTCTPIYGPGGTYFSTPEWIDVNDFLTEENYQFNGLYTAGGATLQSITSYGYSANLGSKFEWGSSTASSITRYFRVITYTNLREGTSGSDPSNKVGQLGFLVNEEACSTSANYDPFGQVFDRNTLQPVEDATVALYREISEGGTPEVLKYKLVDINNTPGIIARPFLNPVSSSSFGMFSFVVPPGMYKLLVSVNNPPAVLPENLGTNQTALDPNVTELGNPLSILVGGSPQVLYPEVYQVSALGGEVSLPVIDEGDVPERRDLSVMGLSVEDPKVLFHRRRVNSAGDNIIRGRINKPLGIVTARRGTDVLGSTAADIKGEFRLVISSDQLPRGESYGLQASSVPLRPVVPTATPTPVVHLQNWLNALMDLLLPKVHAQTTSGEVIVQPRLNYLEGYAYDASGAILKNALVTIFDKSLGVPVYNTQADGEGFFKITSEQLPRNDYAIYYTPEGSSSIVSITAEKFYAQNEEYIQMNKIDVNKPKYGETAQAYLTKNPEPSVTTTQGTGGTKQGTPGELNKGVAPTRAVEQNNPVNQLSPALLMYVAILLLLIVGAGLLIVYYMKRRQEPHLYE